MNLTDAAREAGITPRQANHWFHEGLIDPVLRKRNGEPAPEGVDPRGYRWDLDEAAAVHLAVMADLVRLGVAPHTAAGHAKLLVVGTALHGALVTITCGAETETALLDQIARES